MAEKSIFQFTDPELLEVVFKKNSDFDAKNESKPGKLKIEPRIDGYPDDDKKFYLSLRVATSGDGDEPYSVNIMMRALFDAKNIQDLNQIKQFARVNAPALVYSYIRPLIAYLANQSGNGPFHLPFYNFSTSDNKENKRDS
ncbi:protein-export chaperone SecB [Lentilactobacillus otakiensis]|uniref:protein-export chaperone SecB n=1 Tax=Lentilactobacillus otakiensis TaxID=481720 RepID=UPI001CBC3B2C|nr:protein-export chaperone SecB [Lentilactobacillus otakiensis]MBZ3776433.1 protein-export chaperone SecB [Lentilactobacillus otakiensis]